MSSSFSKRISVVIPTLDRGDILTETLKNLLRQDYTDFEIVVVDQTKTPKKDLLDSIKSQEKIKYIHLDRKGSPHARNVGVKNASGTIILFLDDDIEIRDKEFIRHHANCYTDSRIGLVGGRVIYDFEKPSPDFNQVGRLKFFGLYEITNFDANIKTEIDHAAGGNFSVLKSVFNDVGGFEELYRGNAHMEETDFCLRVKRAGWKLIFEPRAVVRHLQSASGGNRTKDIYDFRYWLVHNFVFFYLKNYPKILFPLCFVREFFWALSSSLKRFDFKMFVTMFNAIIDGTKFYRKTYKI